MDIQIIKLILMELLRTLKIDREEYYAGAIIDSYNWADIGVEEFTIEQRNCTLIPMLEEWYILLKPKRKRIIMH